VKHNSRQKGFTILELIIATGIFAVLMLVILGAVTQIGRMYYKGVTSSRTQEVSRTIIERVTQEIQYSGSDAWNAPQQSSASGQNVLCVGNSRFFWVTNRPKSSTAVGLWTDDGNSGAGACNASLANLSSATPTVATNARELLPDGMRIVNFTVTSAGTDLYTVSIRVVYWTGPDSELDSSGGIAATTCTGGAGATFCSVSELTSTVYKRL
jgi:prepilin-type N-terminal cleavage/methylation domain-containing protein